MAKDYNSIVRQITEIRIQKGQLENKLLTIKQQLTKTNYLEQYALSRSMDKELREYQNQAAMLRESIVSSEREIGQVNGQEDQLIRELVGNYGGFDKIANLMSDQFPILFFPVRIETVFNNSPMQLWLRVFPDEIAIDTHEENLSDSEYEEGKMYWRQFVDAQTEEDKVQAWDLLCRSFSAERAAWVALQTTPTNLSTNPSSEELVFPELETQPDSWSKQPLTQVMPDAFVVHAIAHDGSEISYQMNTIPDQLKMGIDPTLDGIDASFDQRDVGTLKNELTADSKVDWMIDFDAAIAKGMGAKIDLTQGQFVNGFEKIFVVGVKSTLTPEASAERLETLLSNHHYTDGLSLLKQGTRTNNTEDGYSGFQSVEFGNKTTYQTERLDPLFQPVPINRDKTDGQFLCEALGINYDTLYHVFQSDGSDIRNSMTYNIAAFQATIGYTLSDLTPIFKGRKLVNDNFRRFFINNVRARGILPSIRSGNQPYGILPTSVFKKEEFDEGDIDFPILDPIHEIVDNIDEQWQIAVQSIGYSAPGQQLMDVLSHNAVSTDYIQRVGVGSGYIWNNIEYAALDYPRQREWQNTQLSEMEKKRQQLGDHFELSYPGLQINYLDRQSNVNMTTVMNNANENEPLPRISDVGNVLDVLAVASFHELRDENFERYGVRADMVDKELRKSMLYTFSRQSVMLEFYEAACEILKIPEEDRGEKEFINIINEYKPQRPGPMGPLRAGKSRLMIMEQPFEGVPISEVLSSERIRDFPQAVNLVDTKRALGDLAKLKVGDLSLLIREGIDTVTYRPDTWKMALLNKRLNELRGITNGSLERTMGIHLGAYGWVENVKRRTDIHPNLPPTTDGQFPDDVLRDNSNKGFIHAPSMNQATTAAVMLSGYSQRAEENREDPLSVNLSSERVRSALDMMEGIRNGQDLGVLLGYEFERKFRELLPDYRANVPLYNLRNAYPLDKFVVDVAPDPEAVEKISTRNVVDGNKLVELFKEGRIQDIIENADLINDEEGRILLEQSVDWIWNLSDAVADIANTEGIFQIVQGNTIKGGAAANALSKGRHLPEPDVVPSTKQGLEIPQRFTLHFDTANPEVLPNNWANSTGPEYRVQAEPYINKWLCTMLPDPADIYCRVSIRDTETHHWVNASDIGLHAADLMYLMGEDLKDGDDILSLIIKKQVRTSYNYTREDDLAVDYYSKNGTANFSFAEVHPVLLYAQKLLNSARHLNTHDYMLSSDMDGVVKSYHIEELTVRFNTAKEALTTARNTLQAAVNATAFNKNNIVNALYNLSFFGIEQTVYEFVADTTPDEEETLRKQGAFVLQVANDKLEKAMLTEPIPASGDDPTEYVTQVLEAFKNIFDANYTAVPLFNIREEELSYLTSMVAGTTTLTNDHPNNPLLTEEWMSSIAKVKANAAHYEILSILAETVDPVYSTRRTIVPLQLPYANDGSERWLGSSVNDKENLKGGRVAMGASLPSGHSIDGYQAGIMVEEWMDVVPFEEQTSGISFHYDQPGAKAPQCLILGLTPKITGFWQWEDIAEMIEETLDMAKKRGINYRAISGSVVGQLPGMIVPFSQHGNVIGLSQQHITTKTT